MPKISSKVETKVVDKGADRIRKELKKLNGSYATIGVHDDAGSYTVGKNPASVPMVAFWMEFGTKRIPERPFIRSTLDTQRDKLNTMKDELLNEVVQGHFTVKDALDAMGFRIQVLVQNRIKTAQQWATPLARSTHSAKDRPGKALRGSVPLIDTGLLLRSVTFRTKVNG